MHDKICSNEQEYGKPIFVVICDQLVGKDPFPIIKRGYLPSSWVLQIRTSKCFTSVVQYFTQSQDGTLSMPYLTQVPKVHNVGGMFVAVKSVACSDLQADGAN